MQARLKDLERQLELAKSASASSSSKTRQLEERQDDSKSRNEAMSAWVKDALGEANTIVRDGNQEPSWLGLGGWVSCVTFVAKVLALTPGMTGPRCWSWHRYCCWRSSL